MLALSQTRVTAPVDGVVSEKLVSAGGFVSQTTSIITLVPPGVSVVANLPEQQLGSVQLGQTVNFTVSAYPGKTFQGQLRGGMLANLGIVTGAEHDVITVPRTALINSGAAAPGQPSSVWVIDPTNVVRATPITLGILNDTRAEVTAGLDAGQLVATGSIFTLTEGQVVAPQVLAVTALVVP